MRYLRHNKACAPSRVEGFVLIELLVVVGIVAVLFSVIFVAVDPAGRFAQTRNANRREDVRDVVEAVLAFTIDTGNDPPGLDSPGTSSQVIGTAPSGCDITCTATTTLPSCLDLGGALVGGYIAEVPKDPKTGTDANTDYFINRTADGRVLVGSCDPESGVTDLYSAR
ncbi:hypothetical protein EPO33_00640 [Patescibacteria group bacterium]|nr:MAG: hypothetical protein EPO33_00640 [Patescibacteria group bacterium]